MARRLEALDRVRAVMVETLHLREKPGELDPDAPLFGTGLGLDSVDGVELIIALETELGIASQFLKAASALRSPAVARPV